MKYKLKQRKFKPFCKIRRGHYSTTIHVPLRPDGCFTLVTHYGTKRQCLRFMRQYKKYKDYLKNASPKVRARLWI